MLTVVHNVAGCFIDEGMRPAAKVLPLFEQKNALSLDGKIHAGT
jgi:hypothetical protein